MAWNCASECAPRGERPTYRIIMVTAMAGEAMRHAGFEARADDYITKFYTIEELLDRAHV